MTYESLLVDPGFDEAQDLNIHTENAGWIVKTGSTLVSFLEAVNDN
jgi:hypothetical protein